MTQPQHSSGASPRATDELMTAVMDAAELSHGPALAAIAAYDGVRGEALSAERDRYREALERIADDDCGTWDQAMRYARSVLNDG